MSKPKTIYLDRASFIAWTEGTLLAFHRGRGVVGDNQDHEQAERVLAAGGRVILTANGRPVTEMIETADGYHEQLLKGDDHAGVDRRSPNRKARGRAARPMS